VEKSLLYPLSDGTNVTLAEYLERAKEKHENVVYYATDEALQSQYIAMYRARGIDVAVMSSVVDDRFMQSVEQYKSGVKFKRVDADVDALKDESESADDEAMTELFTRLAGEGAKLTVKLQSLTDTTVPALLNISEESRRMEEMMRFYMPDAPKMPSEATLILNTANPIVAKLRGGEYGDKRDDVAGQVLSLAVLAQRTLSAEELQKFLASSYKLLETL
jgi:molecular chaperone HtpG